MEQTVRRALGHAAKMIEEQERLRMLRDQLENIKVGGGMGEGHGGGGVSDKVAGEAARREEIRQEMAMCEKQIQRHWKECFRVHRLLFDVLPEDERRLVMLRCGQGLSWTQIVFKCKYSRAQCFRKYRRAMDKIGKHWEDITASQAVRKKKKP